MKILFIPHVPNLKVVNRVYEFAKNLDALFLTWEINNSNFKNKINSQLNSFFRNIEVNNNFLKIPLLFKPDGLASKFNTKLLNFAIQKYNIDIVVNANALLFDIKKIKVPVIYDLVDDHLTENLDIGLTKSRVEKIKEDIKYSRGVVCVSDILKEKVKLLNSNVITIENGVDIEKFSKAYSLKKELNLENKKVIGYIGGVDEWTGIDKACESFVKIKNNSLAMIVVGGSEGDFYKNLKNKYKKDIIFTGSISPTDVANYFKTIDIGLIPFKLNNFTNNAFPIKALEYALAGANVISTPLKLLKQKNFPFIKFYDISEFDKAMLEVKKEKIDFNFSEYSWKNQARKLLDFIKANL